MKKITLLILLTFSVMFGYAQTLTIELLTDGYATETAWGVFDSSGTLIAQNGTLANETLVTTNIPASDTECYHFVIIDSYGDGIGGYNGSPQGYLNILYNGTNIGGFNAAASNFGSRLDIYGLGNGCPNVDANIVRINNTPFAGVGNVDVSCMVQNTGLNNLTSFDINYQIGSGATVTQNVAGVNMAIGDFNDYTFTTPWNVVSSGTYDLHVWVSNANGAGVDGNTTNDSKNKDISIASQSVANAPMYEIFTSATCAPCVAFNASLGSFLPSHTDVNVVKYQMNWPTPGDSYYTAEGGVRRDYYGVNSIPAQFVGGQDYASSSTGINNGYSDESGKNAYFTLNVKHAFRAGNTVDIEVDIDPYLTGDYTVHAVVIEGTTTGNIATNGETSFERVMMKMVPDASGTTVTFVDGVHQNLNLSASMAGTNVEEMSDLQVVVFIQHDGLKTIMQSKTSVLDNTASVSNVLFETVELYPNPTTGILNVKTDKTLEISVVDVLGREVYTNTNVLNNTIIDLSNFDKGVYLVSIFDGEHKGTQKIILE